MSDRPPFLARLKAGDPRALRQTLGFIAVFALGQVAAAQFLPADTPPPASAVAVGICAAALALAGEYLRDKRWAELTVALLLIPATLYLFLT